MVQPIAPGAVRVAAASLTEWGTRCLRALDVPEADAALVAGDLVQTSLWGIDSHGIARLTHYLDRLQQGSTRARPAIKVERTGLGTAKVHGDFGLGHVVAHRANAEAIALAHEAGIGAAGVTDSAHCGAIGLYSREAARLGLIGFAFTHADKIAAPHGGHRPFFGTNPISIAFPRAAAGGGLGEPVCLDMATTSIPWNRVINARREGIELPPGAALDDVGNDTRDAAAARALRPLGGPDYGYKGYGLAMMVELLCGPLNGNPYGPFIGPMYEHLERPRHVGAFFVVIDPARFAGGAQLAGTIEQMARHLAGEPGSPRLPGDPEHEAEAERRHSGIPVEPGLMAEMALWSGRLGVQEVAQDPVAGR